MIEVGHVTPAFDRGMLRAKQVREEADSPPQQKQAEILKQLSLEELGNVEVITTSKVPEQVWRTAAAVFVLTQEDIRRSGAIWRQQNLLLEDVERS